MIGTYRHVTGEAARGHRLPGYGPRQWSYYGPRQRSYGRSSRTKRGAPKQTCGGGGCARWPRLRTNE